MGDSRDATTTASGQPSTAQRSSSPRGVGRRLTLAVAGCSLLVAVALSALQLYTDHGKEVRNSERRIESVSAGLQAGLADSLWNLRDDRLRLQLEGIVRLPDMLAAEVWEIDDRGTAERRLRVAAPSLPGQPAARIDHRLALPLVHDDRGTLRTIGQLRVESGFAELRQRLWRQALDELVRQVLSTFLIAFFVLLVVHRMVTRHLRAIAQVIGGYDPRRPAAPIRLDRSPPKRPDELDHVVTTLDTMHGTLEDAYGELSDANARLQADIAAREQAERRAERMGRFYRAVTRSSRVVARMHPPQRLFDEICRICVETGHASMAILWLLRVTAR